MDEYLQNLENFARNNNIPVLLDDSAKFLAEFVSKKQFKNILEIGNLEEKDENNNGGIILYQDTIKDNNTYEIKMWIDKEFEKKIDNVSYEIKVNSR